MLSSTLLLTSLSALAAAKTIEVQAPDGQVKFIPDSVTAEKGDKIHVTIGSTHNIVQANFGAPCKPSGADAIFSGDEHSFTFEVGTSEPLWFYCSKSSHCQEGMVFAINPTGDKTEAAFAAAAKKVDQSTTPSKEHGGIAVGSSGGTSTKGSNSTMTSSKASASGTMSASGSSSGSAAATGASSTPTSSSSSHGAGNIAYGSANLEYMVVGLFGALGFVGLF